MDRIFHARIPLYMFFFIAMVGAMALYFLWNRMPLCGAAMLLLLIVAIERVIHTTYTLTADGRLVVSYGRFQRRREIPLQEIRRLEKIRSIRVAGRCLFSYLLVCYGEHEKSLTLMPVKEEEFVETLMKRRKG